MIIPQNRAPLVGGVARLSTTTRLYSMTDWSVASSALFYGQVGVPAVLPAWLRFHHVTFQNDGSAALRVVFDSVMTSTAPVTTYPTTLGQSVPPGGCAKFDLSTVSSSVGIRRILYAIDVQSSPINGMWLDLSVSFTMSADFYSVSQSATV